MTIIQKLPTMIEVLSIKPQKEKVIEVLSGTAWCPKRKGGQRFQIEVLQEKCLHCSVKRKYKCDTPKLMKALRKAREEESIGPFGSVGKDGSS